MFFNQKALNRFLMMTMGIFIAIPFFYYFYLSFHSGNLQIDVMALLDQEPIMGVQLISIFSLPYSAFLLYTLKPSINAQTDGKKVYWNFFFLFVAQLLMGHYLYSGLIIWLLIILQSQYQLKIYELFRDLSGRFFFEEAGGSIVVVVLACLVRWMLWRLQIV